MSKIRLAAACAALVLCVSAFAGLKDETRQPWQRDDTNYVRGWKIAGAFRCDLARDCLDIAGGEASARPDQEQKRADGSKLEWTDHRSYADFIGFDAAKGERDGAVAYAAATIERATAGTALLSVGSSDGVRVWVNGKPVLARDGHRAVTADEDQVEVDLAQGHNTLLVKAAATGTFTVRVLESGAVLTRMSEIGPSIVEIHPDMFSVRTDVSAARAGADPVRVELVGPGGAVLFDKTAKRGELVVVSARDQPDGPYEVRASTKTARGLASVTYLPWFKGDSLAYARKLAADPATAGDDPAGFTLKMLVEMVDDRLGVKLADAKANPWPKIHSPLMEYAEIQLERGGKKDARVHAGGFVRLAWRDDVDATPQYARAYLPAAYDATKKWPLVLHLHGYNPPNPVYWKWWGADSRHTNIDTEFSGGRQVIMIEPHGRGNTQYSGLGDADLMRVIAEAKRTFNVDENRIYLSGESMGGWGTWNVGTRHPDVFAAIGPIFGGVDYHSQMSEEQLAALMPADRFLNERRSSWAQAEGLNNTPVFIRHGDSDQSVNVEWSRWAVKLLQRWGYDVRYREYPGRIHEALEATNTNINIEWFLQHVRNPDPRQVRLRTAELRHAQSFWVDVKQFVSPLEFANVDAEVVERNVIRLDTRNVSDVALTPSAALVDPAQPVTVVWNGVSRDLRFTDGALRLTDPAYKPAGLVKTATLPGGFNDFTTTPFAVVIGTTSKDPEMARQLRAKAEGFIAAWTDWQKFAPRVFEDGKITDADMSKYSLLLFGGADANSVTARVSAKLPLRLSKDRVTLDGQVVAGANALVQLVYPNPRNIDRYVWLVAANSSDALLGTSVTPYNLTEWDWVIQDGHQPAYGQLATPTQTALASGFFDAHWHYTKPFAVEGDAKARQQANRIRRPAPGQSPAAAVLDRYVGKYRLPNGNLVEITREGAGLVAVSDARDAMWAQGDADFYLPRFSVWLTFVSDATGKVTGIRGSGVGDFEAPRVE